VGGQDCFAEITASELQFPHDTDNDRFFTVLEQAAYFVTFCQQGPAFLRIEAPRAYHCQAEKD
jgi:hypothetical protein